MTLAEMREEVMRRLRESASSPVFWTDNDVNMALNDAYQEISDASEWYEDYTIIPLVEAQPYYDTRIVISRPVLTIGPAFNVTTNRWLIHTAVRDLDIGDSRWEQRTGEPDRLMVRSLFHLGYWPRKALDSGTIKQYYTALPQPMYEDTSSPGIPEQFHLGLVEFASYDLWAQDGEVDLALAAWKEYTIYEGELMAFVGNRASHQALHGQASDVT